MPTTISNQNTGTSLPRCFYHNFLEGVTEPEFVSDGIRFKSFFSQYKLLSSYRELVDWWQFSVQLDTFQVKQKSQKSSYDLYL